MPAERHELSAERPRKDAIDWADSEGELAENEGYSGRIVLTMDYKDGRMIGAEVEKRERRHTRRTA